MSEEGNGRETRRRDNSCARGRISGDYDGMIGVGKTMA
jgi:hypothetical protein